MGRGRHPANVGGSDRLSADTQTDARVLHLTTRNDAEVLTPLDRLSKTGHRRAETRPGGFGNRRLVTPDLPPSGGKIYLSGARRYPWR